MPPFNWFFRPILVVLSEGGSMLTRDFREKLVAMSGLTRAELAERIPSGQFTVFESRTGWARTYLHKAGYIERVSRGMYRISDAGRKALAAYPDEITITDLCKEPVFKAWHTRKPVNDPVPITMIDETGVETIAESLARLEVEMRTLVVDDLRELLASMTPNRFEWLVEQLVILLVYVASES